MFNYSEQIAQDMNNRISSQEHLQLFRQPKQQIKIASHNEKCCSCEECSDSCPCQECDTECKKCHSKNEIVANIFLQLSKLSELLDNNGLIKSAQSILDAADIGEEELFDEYKKNKILDENMEIDGLSDEEELALTKAVEELELQPPNELPDIDDEEQDQIVNKQEDRSRFWEELGKKEIEIDEPSEEELAWSYDLSKSDQKRIDAACRSLDTWLKKNAQNESEIDLIDLGLKMMNWHTGQGDPVYMVASYFIDNEDYPDLEKVDEAKTWLESDLRKEKNKLNEFDEEIEDSIDGEEFLERDPDEIDTSAEDNINELEEIIFNLDQHLTEHNYSMNDEDLDEQNKY